MVALLLLPPLLLLLVLPGETVVSGKGETSAQLVRYRSLSALTDSSCRLCLMGSCQEATVSEELVEWCCQSTPCEVGKTWQLERAEILAGNSVSAISSIDSAQAPAVLETGVAATCLLLFLLAVIVGLLMASNR